MNVVFIAISFTEPIRPVLGIVTFYMYPDTAASYNLLWE